MQTIQTQPLNKCRILPELRKHFKVEDNAVIAWDNVIYCNKELHPDVLIHEQVHLKQQKEIGIITYKKKYINDKDFRLEMERQAYKAQLDSIENKELKEAVREDCIINLTSGLYGKITKEEARNIVN